MIDKRRLKQFEKISEKVSVALDRVLIAKKSLLDAIAIVAGYMQNEMRTPCWHTPIPY